MFNTTSDSTVDFVYLLTNAPVQAESVLYAVETGPIAMSTTGTFSLQVINNSSNLNNKCFSVIKKFDLKHFKPTTGVRLTLSYEDMSGVFLIYNF